MNVAIRAVMVSVLLGVSSMTQATMFTIEDVLGGSSGFGASSFHDASGSDPMSGPIQATVPSVSVISGLYNDVTGDFNATMGVSTGGTFTLSGTGLLFNATNTLATNSQLSISFTNPTGLLQNTVIGFLPGYVCCGSTNQDPNSFIDVAGGKKTMTFWGANFDGSTFNGVYNSSTLGMDLRLQMSAVPVPAAAWLFVSGLLGLVGVARRKNNA